MEEILKTLPLLVRKETQRSRTTSLEISRNSQTENNIDQRIHRRWWGEKSNIRGTTIYPWHRISKNTDTVIDGILSVSKITDFTIYLILFPFDFTIISLTLI